MAVGRAEHGAPGEGIYLPSLGSPTGQHIATITVRYMLSPASVTDLNAAKQALPVHTIGELVLL